ncbi:NADP-dependent phosphogluconate dehydrogenase [bacterium]|nr:NADP-dependent phosphogluconate dehydrogenase [bacterium]
MKQKMEIGLIGLGRMGANMVGRMLAGKKVEVVVWNRSKEPVQKAVKMGARAAGSVNDLVAGLKQERRIVWLMLPAGKVTENFFWQTLALLKEGDIIIDGANSHFGDTLRRHREAEAKGVGMLDVGVSGGIIAAPKGYPMMIGGKEEIYNFCRPVFESVGREEGFDRVGGPGAGHYVKMVHNAIEYGMMQAIAEGFDLLAKGRFEELDLNRIAHIWNHGTIISSFLMEMAGKALEKSSSLDRLRPYVEDTGEGRWAALEAIEQAIPFVANSYAVNARFMSRDENSMAFRMLAAMRHEFGDHPIKEQEM